MQLASTLRPGDSFKRPDDDRVYLVKFIDVAHSFACEVDVESADCTRSTLLFGPDDVVTSDFTNRRAKRQRCKARRRFRLQQVRARKELGSGAV